MAYFPVTKTEAMGLVLDETNATLPPEAWTFGKNIRFGTTGTSRAWGDAPLLETLLPAIPRALLASDRSEVSWSTLSIATTKLTAALGEDLYDVTPETWNFLSTTMPTGCFLNNLPILNASDCRPHYWIGDVLTEAAPLPGLDTAVRFRTLRSFGNFLVALGVQDVGATSINPHQVMWSTTADPGFVPPTWDPIGSQAGTTILAAAKGDLLDCLPLGDVNYIYTTTSVYSQQFVGGNYIFKFGLRFEDFGILATNCVASFKNFHFVVTSNDFIVHNGVSWESVASGLIRDYFSKTLDKVNADKTHVIVNESQKEIWVFYPSNSDNNSGATSILIWNWETKAWGIRTCAATFCGTVGYVKPSDILLWASQYSQDTTWDEAGAEVPQKTWSFLFKPGLDMYIFSAGVDKKIRMIVPTMTRDGKPFESVWERTALGFEQQDRFGNYSADPVSHKLILEVYPIIKGIVEESNPLKIYIGGQTNYNSPVTWQGPFLFVPQRDTFITPAISGKFVAIKFVYNGTQDILIEGYKLKYESVGVYQ